MKSNVIEISSRLLKRNYGSAVQLFIGKLRNQSLQLAVFKNPMKTAVKSFLKTVFASALLMLLIECEIAEYPYFVKRPGGDHGMLWVANSADNTVTCIDRMSEKKIGTYAVGPNPSRTAVDLDGNCWVGSRGDGTVYFVTTKGKTTRYEGFNAVRGVALDRDGNVWIANSGNSTIQKISADKKAVSEQVALAGAVYLYGALVDAEGFLWIADQTAAKLYKYDISAFPDPAAFTVVTLSGLYGFTIDTKGKVWAAGYSAAVLAKIDAETAVVEMTYPVPPEIFGGSVCAVTFDTKGSIWVSNDARNSLLRFDPESGIFEEFTISGTTPHGLGSGDEGYVYSVNNGSNTVSKINIKTGKEEHTFTVGNAPYTYSDLTGFIYRHVTLKESGAR